MSNASDFIIENGVLIKYIGRGGDVVIPDGATTIGGWAFRCCQSPTSVTIPDRVTTIVGWAFFGCNNLTIVNYKGTQEQWGQISIGSENGYLISATINYNYTGE